MVELRRIEKKLGLIFVHDSLRETNEHKDHHADSLSVNPEMLSFQPKPQG